PAPAPGVSGAVTVYDGGFLAAGQNAGADAAPATGDNTPIVLAGEVVGSASRFTASTNPDLTLGATTTGVENFYDAQGNLALSVPVACSSEGTLGTGWDCSTQGAFPGSPAPTGLSG